MILVNIEKAYCLSKQDEIYAVYLPTGLQIEVQLGLSDANGVFDVCWHNPRAQSVSSELMRGSKVFVESGEHRRSFFNNLLD